MLTCVSAEAGLLTVLFISRLRMVTAVMGHSTANTFFFHVAENILAFRNQACQDFQADVWVAG